MKKWITAACLTWMISTAVFAQGQFKYFRVDAVKTVTGIIQEIKVEPCYRRNMFTVLYLKEKAGGKLYRVEVSPQWFFKLDLMQGNRVEITGSFSRENDQDLVLAQSITFQGETYRFRDRNGFPLWRGKGKRGGKGKMRRKGRR